MRREKNGLSRRLATAAGFVRAGARVADVGCDHGQLTAYLIESGRAAYVIATDINSQPLQKTTERVARRGLGKKAETRLCDGLRGVSGSEIDDVVIAGLGPDVMASIIGEASWLRDDKKRIILVPASHHERLRIWLCQNGFAIEQEQPVAEGRHCYTILMAAYEGRAWTPDAVFAALGRILPDTPDGKAYYQRVYRRAVRLVAALSDGEKRADAQMIIRVIQERLHGSKE